VNGWIYTDEDQKILISTALLEYNNAYLIIFINYSPFEENQLQKYAFEIKNVINFLQI
jgi:hypothetical protein